MELPFHILIFAVAATGLLMLKALLTSFVVARVTTRGVRFLLVPALVSIGASVFGQTTSQGQYWLRYYAQVRTGERTSLHVEVDERRFFSTHEEAQFVVHGHFHYRMNPYLDVAAGLTYTRTHSIRNHDLLIPEWRPFQEVSADFFPRQTTHKPLTFRFRMDERFVRLNDGYELQDGTLYVTRARFRLQTAWQLFAIEDRRLMVKLHDEVMIHWGDVRSTFDQNRISLAADYAFNRRFSLECSYIDIWQSVGVDEFVHRSAVRLTLFHRMDLLKARKA